MGIFEEVVHEDDELAHTGGHRDERFFSGGAEAQIKVFEDPVMSYGAEDGHVESLPHRPASATNRPEAFLRCRCHGHREPARPKGGSRLFGERSQFGHFGQNGGGDDGPSARDGLQTAGFMGQLGILGNERGNGFVALADLFFQETE